jgi:triosephosphate isomerase
VDRVHTAIRALLASAGSEALRVPIIYGGSVAPSGAGALLQRPAIDGLFVGRRALDPLAFAEIAHTPIQRSRSAR